MDTNGEVTEAPPAVDKSEAPAGVLFSSCDVIPG